MAAGGANHQHHLHQHDASGGLAAASLSSSGGFDWKSEESLGKWRGIFVHPLEKVLRQVHPSLVAQEDALQYLEGLILQLLAQLMARPAPTTVADIEERVSKTFPTPIGLLIIVFFVSLRTLSRVYAKVKFWYR